MTALEWRKPSIRGAGNPSAETLADKRQHSDPIVHAKFFTPDSQWTWYVTGSDEDGGFRFFGFVCGMDDEWGCFVLSELEAARGPMGLPIERDLHCEPGPLTKVMAEERRNRGG